jgi:hypothetical protein
LCVCAVCGKQSISTPWRADARVREKGLARLPDSCKGGWADQRRCARAGRVPRPGPGDRSARWCVPPRC